MICASAADVKSFNLSRSAQPIRDADSSKAAHADYFAITILVIAAVIVHRSHHPEQNNGLAVSLRIRVAGRIRRKKMEPLSPGYLIANPESYAVGRVNVKTEPRSGWLITDMSP